jgi:hypothetical protein
MDNADTQLKASHCHSLPSSLRVGWMRVWDFKNEVSKQSRIKKNKKREFKSAMIGFQTLIGSDAEF